MRLRRKAYTKRDEKYWPVPTWSQFVSAYTDALADNRVKFPKHYPWDEDRVLIVTKRLLQGYWEDVGVSYNGRVLQQALRHLGQPYTKETVRKIVENEKLAIGNGRQRSPVA